MRGFDIDMVFFLTWDLGVLGGMALDMKGIYQLWHMDR